MIENVLRNQNQLDVIFNKYDLVAVYLFGSRVDGSATPESDFDFGLLFRENPSFEEAVILETNIVSEASEILNADVDTMVLNSASIEQKFLIIKRGIVVYSSNDNLRTDFEDVTIRDYLDFKPFLNTFRKEVRETIKEGGFYA
ncbi:MAG: nucleotidyltransferase domain-containing protein [Clostridiales bacterium]|jgi:predicted nucleotidyltransferase|nr:nucleotidyltransferase domain-containing protein [Clostridiales bacterium]